MTASASPASLSGLYECSVLHARLSPRKHRFLYRLFLFRLDLDELDHLSATLPGFSRNRWNLYEFRDRDHLTLPGMASAGIKEQVLAWIQSQPEAPPLPADPQVILVTLPRVLGHIFNPVSFFFLTDRSSGKPSCAVVEVGNTFRELKPYLLLPGAIPCGEKSPASCPSSPDSADRQPEPASFSYRLVTPKHFYVSPFSAPDHYFDFQLQLPGKELRIHINTLEGASGPPVVLSTLTGNERALTAGNLFWLTVKFPFITLKVIFLIHWEAFRLWLRRIPFHRKAANPQLQRDLFPPVSR